MDRRLVRQQGDDGDLDVLLETPGGSGEVAEDIVRLLRGRFHSVAFIVPGYAKSAGTIMTMAGDEILMGPASALGPIDAQMAWQGKTFSAEALIEGLKKIKEEVARTNSLNRAYIPILQGLSPGELEKAQNALDFARVLVADWLAKYKFHTWTEHSSNGKEVTAEERAERANEIAQLLCSHSYWLTHARSIKIDDLREMRLEIIDYTADTELTELADAIQRYHTLLQMTFTSNIYKVIETPTSQIYRFSVPQGVPAPEQGAPPGATRKVMLDLRCNNCGHAVKIQASLGDPQPLEAGAIPFPDDNIFKCPNCGIQHDLSQARRQIESQSKKSVVPPLSATAGAPQ